MYIYIYILIIKSILFHKQYRKLHVINTESKNRIIAESVKIQKRKYELLSVTK